MVRVALVVLLAFEIFALANRGGAPLLSHLVLTGVTFFVVCLWAFFRAKSNVRPHFAIVAYWAFFLCFIVSVFTGITPQYGLSELLLFGDVGLLLVLFSGSEIKEKDLQLFIYGLIGLALIDVLIGYFIYTQTPFPRFAGTFLDLKEPYISTGNDFANFVLLILPLAIAQFLKKHTRITTTILSGLVVAILFSGFLLSFSRAAWLSFVAAIILLAVWIFIQRKKAHEYVGVKKILLRSVAAIIVVVLLTSGLQYVRGQRFETLSLTKKLLFQADEGGSSASERAEYWNAAAQIIKNEPLTGSGVLSFRYLFPGYQKTFGINVDQPHNIFLKIGVENGVFAVAFFLAFLIGMALLILKFLWHNPWHSTLPLAFGSLAALGHNLLDFNFISSNFTLFALFAIVTFSFAHQQKNAQNSSRIKLVFASGILICSFMFLLLGVHEGFYNIDFQRGRNALASGQIDASITRLERAGRLFFERDLSNYLADAYERKYQQTNDRAWRERERKLLTEKITYPTTGDVMPVSRMVDVLCEEGGCKNTEKLTDFALKLDPKNNLKYYFQYFYVRQQLGKQTAPELTAKTNALLKEYVDVLRNNRHFTILTENPKYASKLYEMLGMTKEKDALDSIWTEELIKFAAKYGAEAIINNK